MNRFFTSEIIDNKAYLTEEDAYHLKNVLRAKTGELFEVCNGIDKEYIAKLVYIDKRSAELEIIENVTTEREPKHKYILCQCIPKCRKSDDVVRHATELGMAEFYPVLSERINVKDADGYDKTDRLQRIVNEAAKQSKRIVIPTVNKPIKIEELIKNAPADAFKLIAWEEERDVSLRKAVAEYNGESDVYIIIGPEGGLSEAEVSLAKENGWRSISLGKRILRTETAPLTVLSAVSFALGDLE